jgi:hypothetical protein
MCVGRYRAWGGDIKLFHYIANSYLVRNNRVVISESHIKARAFAKVEQYNNMISSIVF